MQARFCGSWRTALRHAPGATRSAQRFVPRHTAAAAVGVQARVPKVPGHAPLHGAVVGAASAGALACAPLHSLAQVPVVLSAGESALVGPLAVKFLQVVPPVAAQLVFLAPLEKMKEFKRDKTTGDMPVLPYVAMFTNGVVWMTYGALQANLTLVAPNITAALFGAYYTYTFHTHRNPNTPVVPAYLAGAATLAAIGGTALALPTAAAVPVIGKIGCLVVAVMFASPLASIREVVRSKSTKALHLGFTLASFVNCVLWTAYGLLVIADPYIYWPNAAGLAASVAQLALFVVFRR